MKTYLPDEATIERKWRVIDADGQVLGRMAVRIADMLRGRDKPTYTPHLDTGDFVVVVNAEKVVLTGRKNERKVYQDYSGYMGGLRERPADEIRANNPERLVEDAVWGMLPHNRLGRKQFRKLHVYKGPDHPHTAQQPESVDMSATAANC